MRCVIVDPEETVLTGIEFDPRGSIQRNPHWNVEEMMRFVLMETFNKRTVGVFHFQPLDLSIRWLVSLETDRDVPFVIERRGNYRLIIGIGRIGEETRLSHNQITAIDRVLQNRETHLASPRVHDAADVQIRCDILSPGRENKLQSFNFHKMWLESSNLKRIPQVRCSGIIEFVILEEFLNSKLKIIFAHEMFEHSQDGGTLAVRNPASGNNNQSAFIIGQWTQTAYVSNSSVISSGWLTVWTIGCELNLASNRKTTWISSVNICVSYGEDNGLVKGTGTNVKLHYNVPIGVNVVGPLVFHVTGKTFVEPQVVPPANRH